MTEVSATSAATLRAMLPRLFSRAPGDNGLDTLQRTLRKHHPKADWALVERAYRSLRKLTRVSSETVERRTSLTLWRCRKFSPNLGLGPSR